MPPSKTAVQLAALLITAAIIGAWANSFRGPLVYDDYPSILMNPTIRHLTDLRSVLQPPPDGGMTVAGRPILNLSLALNYAISGPAVWSYHALNLLIHLCAALLAFGLIRQTLELDGSRWSATSRLRQGFGGRAGRAPSQGNSDWLIEHESLLIALAAALLWALHPLQTESVTYLIQRAESLMGLWYLLTLYAFVRGCRSAHPRVWWAAAIAACALGMGTKEVMVSAPVMAFLFDRAFVSGSLREAWRRHGTVHCLLAATWLILLLELHLTHGRGNGQFDPGVSWGAYALTQFGAVVHYLRLFLWPRPLIFDYGAQWVSNGIGVIPAALAVLTLAAATLIACVRRPRLGFLALWFFAILAPTSLVPGARQTIAEHRMYLALLPLAFAAAWLAVTPAGRTGLAILVAAAIGLACTTAARNRTYRSDVSLWADTAAHRPANPLAHHNYGLALADRGDLPAAIPEYRQALALDPRYAKAHANLAAALLGTGHIPDGLAEFQRAIALRPDFEDARHRLGQALAATGHLPEAIAQYRSALQLVPEDRFVHLDLARALAQSGQLDAAIPEAERAISLDQQDPDPEVELGKMLAQSGQLDAAAAHLKRALTLDPSRADARDLLAWIPT